MIIYVQNFKPPERQVIRHYLIILSHVEFVRLLLEKKNYCENFDSIETKINYVNAFYVLDFKFV